MSIIDESFTIKASPTKELFIYMMTRDIPLIRAILDLVDNSVDGATRMQPCGDYSKFWVRIECTKEHLPYLIIVAEYPFQSHVIMLSVLVDPRTWN